MISATQWEKIQGLIQRGLDDFELHAGITYLDNEPLSHVRSQPLYQERYVLLTTKEPGEVAATGIGWAAAAQLPLCLLVSEMQNRRIVDAAFAKARSAHGQERILVNCAGVGGGAKTVSRDKQTGDIKEYPLENFERIIQINVIGTFRCIAKSAAGMLSLPPLQDNERGAIVNTASVAAVDGQMGQAAYSASKAGVVGMTLPIARDLMSEGIRINTILPGIFDTPLLAGLPEAARASLGEQVPFPPRLGRPDEFAALVQHIAENSMLNGEVIRLDGAIRMAPR